jgi:hypothetical protein
MSELPAEILHDIFFCLELKERLECLRVCRRWWKALDSYNLYYSFVIRREEQFKAMRHANASTCAQMYQYMIKKYPNINKMDYYDAGLKDYDASERRYVYFNGILDFLKMIAPAQNRLFLQALTDDVNAFEALDAGHSQIEELFLFDCESETMLAYLGQSKQSGSIRSIHMLDTIIKNLQPLKDMPALTALHIGYEEIYEERIDLSDCLRACPPTLRSLTIHNGEVFVLPLNQQLESIEYLKLGMVYIDTDLGNIISNCLPDLTDLELSGTLVCDVEITLKNPRRVYFHIGDMDGYSDTQYGFSFKCPNMTEPRYYSCCFDRAKQVEHGDIKGLPLLSVESLTVKKCKEGNNGIYID